MQTRSWLSCLMLPLTLLVPTLAHADEHGPAAPSSSFPSHRWQLRAHSPDAQLSFHYGLLQPLLLKGFNAAVDLRLGRFVATYSHGQGLDLTSVSGTRTGAEEKAGLRVTVPYTTGGGVGVTLIDELYVLADFKAHRYELFAGRETNRYTTVTVGAEVGWRFFIWKGLHVTPVLRYWPNVWDSAPKKGVAVATRDGGELLHKPLAQGAGGFFANVLVGWAFNLLERFVFGFEWCPVHRFGSPSGGGLVRLPAVVGFAFGR